MPNIANSNSLFQLSGVIPGLYTFLFNPESIEVIPSLQKTTVLKTIAGEDIRQSLFFDNEVRTMSWSRATNALYADLKLFATRDANGNIPTTRFWDGTLAEMQGVNIHVLDVHGEPLSHEDQSTGYGWKINLNFKPIAPFDKAYKLAILSGGSNAQSGIRLTVNVPDSTYDIQAYDTLFNPIITGTSFKTYVSTSGNISVTITGINMAYADKTKTRTNDADLLLATKNGWVVAKTYLTGIYGGEAFALQ